MSRAKRTGSTDTRGCAWTTAYDGAREERRYMCPNWRADVSAIVTSAGKLTEMGKDSAYGTRFECPANDTDSNGTWDATDSTNTTSGTYEVRKDSELNGTNDANDVTYANSIKGTYQTLGYGVLSSTAVANRKGYGGYEADIYLSKLDHVRFRVFDTMLGRWTRRDPVGYADGANTYSYCTGSPVARPDFTGLCAGYACTIIHIYSNTVNVTPYAVPGGGGSPPGCLAIADPTGVKLQSALKASCLLSVVLSNLIGRRCLGACYCDVSETDESQIADYSIDCGTHTILLPMPRPPGGTCKVVVGAWFSGRVGTTDGICKYPAPPVSNVAMVAQQ